MSNQKETFKIDYRYLKIATSLGYRNIGYTWPNPSVGCVIVKNNHIVGTGSTGIKGRPHAEKLALEEAKSDALDSTVYTTLEPCSHFGKTNPCALELVKAKVRRLVCPLKDPDPRVSGRGFELLRNNGIIVDNSSILVKEISELNEGFFTLIEKKRPYVALKLALSLNGKIATQDRKSNWITGKKSRNFVQLLRSKYDAIMVGTKTAFLDNPRLNLRDQFIGLPQPVKIIIDKSLKITKINSNNYLNSNNNLIIVHDINLKKEKIKFLELKRIKTLGVPTLENGNINLSVMLKELAKFGLTRILVEGGGKLGTSLVENNLVDKLILFTAGIILDKEGVDGFKSSISNYIDLQNYKRYTLDKTFAYGNDVAHFWNIKD